MAIHLSVGQLSHDQRSWQVNDFCRALLLLYVGVSGSRGRFGGRSRARATVRLIWGWRGRQRRACTKKKGMMWPICGIWASAARVNMWLGTPYSFTIARALGTTEKRQCFSIFYDVNMSITESGFFSRFLRSDSVKTWQIGSKYFTNPFFAYLKFVSHHIQCCVKLSLKKITNKAIKNTCVRNVITRMILHDSPVVTHFPVCPSLTTHDAFVLRSLDNIH